MICILHCSWFSCEQTPVLAINKKIHSIISFARMKYFGKIFLFTLFTRALNTKGENFQNLVPEFIL